jgi:hypothetical protein
MELSYRSMGWIFFMFAVFVCATCTHIYAKITTLSQSPSSSNAKILIANQQEALSAYYMENYPDVFAVSNRKMVRRAKDGSYALCMPEEVRELTNDGKIKMGYLRSKGGRIADLTQRPVLVLVEE